MGTNTRCHVEVAVGNHLLGGSTTGNPGEFAKGAAVSTVLDGVEVIVDLACTGPGQGNAGGLGGGGPGEEFDGGGGGVGAYQIFALRKRINIRPRVFGVKFAFVHKSRSARTSSNQREAYRGGIDGIVSTEVIARYGKPIVVLDEYDGQRAEPQFSRALARAAEREAEEAGIGTAGEIKLQRT